MSSHRRICLAALLLPVLAPILIGGAFYSDPEITDGQKKTLIGEIQRTLREKAYVSTVDFSTAEGRLSPDLPAVKEARTHRQFTRAINKALEGYAVSHLVLLTPEEVTLRAEGRALGTGAMGRPLAEGAGIKIHEIVPGSPAEDAGLKTWEDILAADGQPVTTSADLTGTEGQVRTLKVKGEKGTREVTIKYRPYNPYRPDELKWLTPKVALISVNTFVTTTYDAKKVAGMFRDAAKAEAIIIDVRYNRGGSTGNVAHLLSRVLPPGTVFGRVISRSQMDAFSKTHPDEKDVLARLKEDPNTSEILEGQWMPYRGRVVVLTSQLSGSGGDMFPAALKETGRARLVGHRTVGKLLVGNWGNLSYGFELLFPVAEVFTLKGHRIEGVGVEPDVNLSHRETLDDTKILPIAMKEALTAPTLPSK